MEKLAELKKAFDTQRPAHWSEFPDIDLYKDQVLSYLPRQHVFSSQDKLTGAMINNYIKSGLLSRASGKKYNREHLSYLTAICTLKQVLSVNDVAGLLSCQPDSKEAEQFYEKYWRELDLALSETGKILDEDWSEEEAAQAALRFAILSFAQKLACERLLDMIEKKEEKNK